MAVKPHMDHGLDQKARPKEMVTVQITCQVLKHFSDFWTKCRKLKLGTIITSPFSCQACPRATFGALGCACRPRWYLLAISECCIFTNSAFLLALVTLRHCEIFCHDIIYTLKFWDQVLKMVLTVLLLHCYIRNKTYPPKKPLCFVFKAEMFPVWKPAYILSQNYPQGSDWGPFLSPLYCPIQKIKGAILFFHNIEEYSVFNAVHHF